MRPISRFLRLLAFAFAVAACQPAGAALPVQGVEVKATYPHDSRAFTQGLLYLNGDLYESTGLVGQSTIRRVRLQDGAVLQSKIVSPAVFGEGLVNWGDELISLTWRDQVGFRWDRRTFALKSSYRYAGEGWALTQNGKQIIMSDGTPVLKFLDPKTLKEVRRITVTAEGRPLANLNELEWVKGEIYANVWMTRLIARIDPQTGVVKGVIDLSALPEATRPASPDAVPNGIAYDAAGDRLFVTGKLWPRLYEVRLTPVRR
ncbi:glutaminyl-peptide cyclotransferase [Phenylobacterium sp. J367]|uniref:glutaminyl-peptide cyclotransferase n=1 Tax=Phenylobacterium sp. J367 TaxID=2898435 RepID=UPI002151F998|nr:glutaminyl-peptide cyclotransferase [Phenylobacterium sp. J367]MCR5880365.1 glutaminyl-peptide cyclotransferase [Phenylobacterium sp. J367]